MVFISHIYCTIRKVINLTYCQVLIYLSMEILNDFGIEIKDETPLISVNYTNGDYTGTCVYEIVEKVGTNKPIRQTILILTHSDMGEVIDYWNGKVKLNEENYNEVSTSIRNHSRQKVEEYLQGQSH
jgi:hypothetical protein